MYKGSDLLAFDELGEITLLIHIKDDDRHVSLTTKGEGCLIHYLKTVFNSLIECQLFILHCRRILLGISSVHSINACSLKKGICTNFQSTESRTGICCEVRITCTATASSLI